MYLIKGYTEYYMVQKYINFEGLLSKLRLDIENNKELFHRLTLKNYFVNI